MKQRRAALSPQEAAAAGEKVCERIRALPEFCAARHVMVYLPVPGANEIDLTPLLSTPGKTFYAPRVTGPHTMEAAPLTEDFSTGAFGIREPTAPACDPQILQLILVPALCVDRQGRRIGFGKGYYDRFLQKTRAPALAAVHEFQLVPHVPSEAHDMPLCGIVHPGGLILCERT